MGERGEGGLCVCVFNVIPQPVNPWKEHRCPLNRKLGGVQNRCGTQEKIKNCWPCQGSKSSSIPSLIIVHVNSKEEQCLIKQRNAFHSINYSRLERHSHSSHSGRPSRCGGRKRILSLSCFCLLFSRSVFTETFPKRLIST